jgi:hypothetical protein
MVVRNVDRVNVVLDTLEPVTGEPVLTGHNVMPLLRCTPGHVWSLQHRG